MTQTAKVKRDSARGDAIVRIDRQTDLVLTALAKQRNEDKKKVLAESVEMLRRESMLEALCEAYTELRDNPEAWAEEQAERAAWESTALAGLKNE